MRFSKDKRQLLYDLRAATLCRLHWHCRPSKRIMKFDGGRYPLLCRYCYLITGHASTEQERMRFL